MNKTKKTIAVMIGLFFVLSSITTGMKINSFTAYAIQKKAAAKTIKKTATKKIVPVKGKKATKPTLKSTPKSTPKPTPKPSKKPVAKPTSKPIETSVSQTTETPAPTPTPTPVVEQVDKIGSMDELFMHIDKSPDKKVVFTDKKIEDVYLKAKDILVQLDAEKLSAFEKEKAIHDYVIANVKLTNSQGKNMSAYDALIGNQADAYGYAESIKLLLRLSGIGCEIIQGDFVDPAGNKIAHYWNLVKMDEKYYHLDTAFDNNINISENTNKDEYINYNCFNVCDDEIDASHSWDSTKYPKADNDKTNFVYDLLNSMLTDSSPVVIHGDWLYYANEDSERNLSKCRYDGESKTLVFKDDASVSDIDASGNWMVYSSDNLYKINLDTNERIKLNQTPYALTTTKIFSIWNNELFYLENVDEGSYSVYRQKLDSNERTIVSENPLQISGFFKVVDGKLYYTVAEDNNAGLICYDLNTKTTTKIIDGLPVNIKMENKWIYFTIQDVSTISDDSGLPKQTKTVTTNYRCAFDGSAREQLGEPEITIKDRVD